MDELTLLRSFRSEIPTPDVRREEYRLQAAIAAVHTGQPRPRAGSTTRRTVLAAAIAAGVAAVVAASVLSHPSTSQRTVAPSGRDVLLLAAEYTKDDAVPRPRADQFVYRRLEVRQPALTAGQRYFERRTESSWLSADASRVGVLDIRIDATEPFTGLTPTPGGPIVVGPSGAPTGTNTMVCGSPVTDRRTDFAYLSTLPTDTAGMAAYLDQRAARWQWGSRDSRAFFAATEMLRDSYVPRPQAAALFRVLAAAPGTVATAGVTDVAGRQGIAVSRTDQVGSRGDARVELLFDATTYHFLGERMVVVDPSLAGVPAGTVIFGYAELEVRIVDRPPVATQPPPGCPLRQ